MVEEALRRLLNKTEKNWGYFQIKKREKVYILHLLGSNEDMLTVNQNESSNSYQLFWYTNSRPSVNVETKQNRIYNKGSKTYQTQKVYQICYQNNPNPLISSINKMFAELVKEKVLGNTQKENKDNEKPPLVTIVQE